MQALAALARNKPEKPLKFLADFLIEHNPNKPTPPPPGGAGQGAGAGVRAPVGVAIVGDSKSKVITKDEK